MAINSFIKSADGITVYVDGKPYNVNNTHANYAKIIDAVKTGDYNLVPDLVALTKAVKAYVDETPTDGIEIDVDSGIITYNNQIVHSTMVSRILDMMKEGFNILPMKKLLVNLYQNPSNRAVEELYTFLEYGKMPITEDGHFLAYKRVNNDYTSCYDNKTQNNIGFVVEMPRNQVDDRSNVTCSHGLHICSFEYLVNYPGDRVIVVKVNPADVVSIPTDYNNTKARVCRYVVIGELTKAEAGLTTHSFNTSVYVEPTPVTKTDAVTALTDTLLDVAVKKDDAVNQPASQWYQLGYINGYRDGRKKATIAEDVTLQDDGTAGMSQLDIDDVNTGYLAGYADGKSHKPRKFPKVK